MDHQCAPDVLLLVNLAHRARKVAVKLVDKGSLKDDYLSRNLHREGDILRRLQHPHIIQLLEIIETGDYYCLVMEFAEGDVLDYLCTHGVRTEDQARTFFRQIVLAIAYMQDCNIVHRCVAPALASGALHETHTPLKGLEN